MLYVAAVKLIGLYDDVIWHASNELEERDIRRWFGQKARVHIAPDLPGLVNLDENPQRREKQARKLKALFLSRVSPKKNLLGALQMLQSIPGRVEYNIYGPLEDRGYWEKCRAVIEDMPEHITVNYRGAVGFGEVNRVFREHDLLFLPTTAENFGHVILESLVNGCPVLISDQTPWCGLESHGIGWDIPLDQRGQYLDVSKVPGEDAALTGPGRPGRCHGLCPTARLKRSSKPASLREGENVRSGHPKTPHNVK